MISSSSSTIRYLMALQTTYPVMIHCCAAMVQLG